VLFRWNRSFTWSHVQICRGGDAPGWGGVWHHRM